MNILMIITEPIDTYTQYEDIVEWALHSKIVEMAYLKQEVCKTISRLFNDKNIYQIKFK